MKEDKIISKRDIILLLVVVLLGCIAYALIVIFSKTGYSVRISCDGEVVKTMSLDKDSTYEFQSEEGYNTIVIRDHKVYVESADCPDKICAGHKPIDKVGETIICLPHKLVVEVCE